MVILGVAFTNSFNQSLLSIYGLVFGEKLRQMGENTVGAALVGNVMLLIFNFSGLIAGPALKRFSSRKVSIVASVISAFGMVLSSFATTKWHLIASYSVFTGLGIGLLQPSTFMAVNAYFTSRRGRANGISMAGTGIGQMLMPHIAQYLLDEYSFKGTALILGGLAMNGVIFDAITTPNIVGAMLFQPVEWHLVKKKSEKSFLIDQKNPKTIYKSIEISSKEETCIKVEVETSFDDGKHMKANYHPEQVTTVNSETIKSILSRNYVDCGKEVSQPTEACNGIGYKINKFFDLDLMLDLTFINITLGCSLGFTSNQNFNMLFPFFLQQEVGMTRTNTAMCMSMLAGADIIARITMPIFTDKRRIPSRMSFYIGCIALSIARTILSYQSEFDYLLVASALTGFFRSSIVINQNLIISEYCKKDETKLPTALALNMVMKGLAIITVGQVLGWIRDYYQSFIPCLFSQNVLLISVFILWTPEFLYKLFRK
ncbi:monocarboxylate transporter 12-B [Arctopsyche grandis]|uniref:monocarboxylate transporter 12-B n=1 Tax=Arctopsyche grandis TaxID=121162 RepID=UPI00406D76D1